MIDLIKQAAADKFFGAVKSGVSDLMVSESSIDTLVTAMSELQVIAGRKLIITPGVCGIVQTKEQYENIVPKSYRDNYTYEEGKGSYPWLWFNFQKQPYDETKIKVQVEKDGVLCTFGDNVANIGTLSEDKKTVTVTSKNYISFEIVKDLNIPSNQAKGNYIIIFTDEEGNDKQMFQIMYV